MVPDSTGAEGAPSAPKRTRKVRPYPIDTLEDSLAVAVAIQESNAGLPFDRVELAGALGTTPASSGYTIRLNSAAKYGLTQGGYNDDRIALTARGEALVAPKRSDELGRALIDAAMHPEVFRRFYLALDGRRLPEDPYPQNMLQREFGINPDLTYECLGIIKANGLYAGILIDASGGLEVALGTTRGQASAATSVSETTATSPPANGSRQEPRIFVGESKNAAAVALVKGVLMEFGLANETAVRGVDDTGPIPVQVSSVMRECTAAVIVIGGDDLRRDSGGLGIIGERALYQIAAASAFYGESIVVMSEIGLDLPTDVASLPNVTYDPDRTGDAAFGLLKELHRIEAIKVAP